ncbi:MAG: hypothetical protein ACREPA_09370 [Candidatus Dormibacteraceae bacterium]
MRHLSDGALRHLLDDPDSIADSQRAHTQVCERCGQALASARADRDATAALLAAPAPAVRTEAALRGITKRVETAGSARLLPRLAARLDPIRIRPAGRPVMVATALVLGAGTAAVMAFGNVTRIFEPAQVAPVTFSAQDMRALPDLSAYGTEKTGTSHAPRQVAGLAAAEAATGLSLTLPGRLPAGVSGQPTYYVVDTEQGSFTFSAAKAQAHAQAIGKALPPMPAGMDGSTLYANVGPAIVAAYGGGPGSTPDFAVAVTKAPSVYSSGKLTVGEIERYLVAQPGFPTGVAQEITKLGDLTRTLPIPIAAKLMSSQRITINNVPGVLITENSGIGSAVVWEKDGLVHAVGGLIDAQAARDAASALG